MHRGPQVCKRSASLCRPVNGGLVVASTQASKSWLIRYWKQWRTLVGVNFRVWGALCQELETKAKCIFFIMLQQACCVVSILMSLYEHTCSVSRVLPPTFPKSGCPGLSEPLPVECTQSKVHQAQPVWLSWLSVGQAPGGHRFNFLSEHLPGCWVQSP